MDFISFLFMVEDDTVIFLNLGVQAEKIEALASGDTMTALRVCKVSDKAS